MSVKLSPTQEQAVAVISANGGKIERWAGGFWTTPGMTFVQRTGYRAPDWYVGAPTIAVLSRLGLLRKTKVVGPLAVEFELTEKTS